MIPTALRRQIRELIDEAVAAGARLFKACAVLGVTTRCLQRWREDGIDRRTTRVQTPHNALTPEEVETILATVNAPEWAYLPPTQIVPRLADKDLYLASESTIYRVLRRHKQLRHRRLERQPQPRKLPRALVASGPNQVASWDITYLPSAVRGQYWYLSSTSLAARPWPGRSTHMSPRATPVHSSATTPCASASHQANSRCMPTTAL